MLGFHLFVCFLVLGTSQLALVLKKLPTNSGDTGSASGLGRFPGEENGNPLQNSWLGNSINRGVWWATVHGLQRVGHDWSDLAYTHLHIKERARRSNQSILKEINPEYLQEELMLKLKLQYFVHLMWRASSLEKTLMLGKIAGQEEKGMMEHEVVGWHHWLNAHESEQTLGDNERQGSLACCSPWGLKESDMG